MVGRSTIIVVLTPSHTLRHVNPARRTARERSFICGNNSDSSSEMSFESILITGAAGFLGSLVSVACF